jgi:hypothetical protein
MNNNLKEKERLKLLKKKKTLKIKPIKQSKKKKTLKIKLTKKKKTLKKIPIIPPKTPLKTTIIPPKIPLKTTIIPPKIPPKSTIIPPKSTNVNMTELLKQCLDSELCLAFGIQATQIKQLFNNFKDLKYIEPPIQRIGEPSSNGFVNKMKFSRDKYDVYVILKSSAAQKSDNLYYEYLIGLEINNWIQIYPTFVDTYGIYLYTSNTNWNYVKKNKIINKNVFLNSLIELPSPTFKKSCLDSKYLAIMIQNLRNSNSISSLLENNNNTELIQFIQFNLPYILFQIYSTLSSMSLNFTHYDLHTGNVLLYQPLKDSYITYHYHLKDNKIIKFNSYYMAKIIDYGRSYFKEKTAEIYKEICKECTKCGEKSGYGWVNNEKPSSSNSYLNANYNNISHDLRLLNMLKSYESVKIVNPQLYKLLEKVIYLGTYGTMEIKSSGLPNKISNVNDAFIELTEFVETHSNMNNPIFKHKLGDLHIYLNSKTPLNFIKNI